MTDNLQERLTTKILDDYYAAKNLVFPMFPIKVLKDKIKEPHLMQRMVVLKLLQDRTIGNWSDMGTGKTLAAVLGVYATKAKLIIVCCPNSVKDEWSKHIKGVFPDANIQENIRNAKIKPKTFLIVNYEQFQQSWSKKAVDQLMDNHKIDFLIFDEIHQAKQRDENMSNRRSVLMHLRTRAEKENKNLYVIGQTGTPCINETMREPVSQLELITGKDHSDLPTVASIPNIFRVRQAMVLAGIRCPSSFQQKLEPIITKIDCTHRLSDIVKVRNNLLNMDQILMEEKTSFILDNINHKEKTIIYVHYVKELVTKLQTILRNAGYRVDTFTGNETEQTRKQVKNNFVDGSTEILIASKPISIGVDGLQKVCHKIIPAILPWTAAEYRQLICRLQRTKQEQDVEVLIPETFIKINGNEWSMDAMRWNRILYKQSIGDMLTDGIVPDDAQLSLRQVKNACIKWFDRVVSGEIYQNEREDIVVEFDEKDDWRNNNFSDLHQMHIKLNKMHSAKTSELFKDKEIFAKYHELYNEVSKTWEIIPREVLAGWCKKGDVVGDFGCGGVTHIAKALPDCEVYSFDHNSLDDEEVICCDIANVPLEDEQLDVAIFSLSLMGCNYKEYLKEALRCLRTEGRLYIADLTNHNLVSTLKEDLQTIGFHVVHSERRSKFTFVKAMKS